jgi:putative spermidine/putrescine transport system substrate-binding protein
VTTTHKAAALFVALALAAPAWAQAPALPSSPQTINVIDVAGNLALTQKEIKAQQNAGRVDIDLVLTGTDGLAAGIEQGLWIELLPKYADKFGNLEGKYLEGAAKMQKLAENKGITVAYYPSGPLLEYMPEKVKQPPQTAEELLAWCKANPNRFMYARPANSGPGRTFLMGLPYILGDKDPKDPEKGWDKTWAYLKQLGECIEYYPSGTGATMKELGEGSRDMITSTTGWDINPRVLGTVPKEARVATLKGFHWVTDAHYMVVPKGVSDEHLAVVLDLMAYLLTPEAQAYTYDEGYFYPGPAVKDVLLSMAPKESQDAIKEFGRPEYEQMIAGAPLETPLDAKGQVAAFKKWDQEVGGAKVKK